MNSYERVMNLLAGKPVDRTPVTPILMTFAAKFIGKPYSAYCRDYRVLVESHLRCWDEFKFDMLMTLSDAYRETHDFGAKVTFPEDDVPLCKDYVVKTPADVKKLKRLDPLKSERMLDRIRAVELFRKEAGGEVPILGWVEGPIAEVVDLRGMNETMLDFHDNPGLFDEMADLVTGVEMAFAREQIKAGADLIGIGDAAASLVSAGTYRARVLPWEQKLIAEIHRLGAKVKLHICGNTTHLLDDLALTAADIVDLDWMVDLAEARRKMGPDVAICGNFDPVGVMLQKKPAVIRAASQRCKQLAGRKFVLSPGCEVPKHTPIENMRALCEAGRG